MAFSAGLMGFVMLVLVDGVAYVVLARVDSLPLLHGEVSAVVLAVSGGLAMDMNPDGER